MIESATMAEKAGTSNVSDTQETQIASLLAQLAARDAEIAAKDTIIAEVQKNYDTEKQARVDQTASISTTITPSTPPTTPQTTALPRALDTAVQLQRRALDNQIRVIKSIPEGELVEITPFKRYIEKELVYHHDQLLADVARQVEHYKKRATFERARARKFRQERDSANIQIEKFHETHAVLEGGTLPDETAKALADIRVAIEHATKELFDISKDVPVDMDVSDDIDVASPQGGDQSLATRTNYQNLDVLVTGFRAAIAALRKTAADATGTPNQSEGAGRSEIEAALMSAESTICDLKAELATTKEEKRKGTSQSETEVALESAAYIISDLGTELTAMKKNQPAPKPHSELLATIQTLKDEIQRLTLEVAQGEESYVPPTNSNEESGEVIDALLTKIEELQKEIARLNAVISEPTNAENTALETEQALQLIKAGADLESVTAQKQALRDQVNDLTRQLIMRPTNAAVTALTEQRDTIQRLLNDQRNNEAKIATLGELLERHSTNKPYCEKEIKQIVKLTAAITAAQDELAEARIVGSDAARDFKVSNDTNTELRVTVAILEGQIEALTADLNRVNAELNYYVEEERPKMAEARLKTRTAARAKATKAKNLAAKAAAEAKKRAVADAKGKATAEEKKEAKEASKQAVAAAAKRKTAEKTKDKTTEEAYKKGEEVLEQASAREVEIKAAAEAKKKAAAETKRKARDLLEEQSSDEEEGNTPPKKKRNRGRPSKK
ncbi:hypothetical protein B7494_g4106 [Chlorociboria aeruginascens]|nr:hypothetical protein B7494_g4106 [Chlorociboria aeruginascens]